MRRPKDASFRFDDNNNNDNNMLQDSDGDDDDDDGFVVQGRYKHLTTSRDDDATYSDDESDPDTDDDEWIGINDWDVSPLEERLSKALESLTDDDFEYPNDEVKALHHIEPPAPPVHTIVNVRVVRITEHAAIVQPLDEQYTTRLGVLPSTEIQRPKLDAIQADNDYYWWDIYPDADVHDEESSMDVLLQVDQVLRVAVTEIQKEGTDQERVVYSLRMVPPELEPSFQPLTLMVFRLPMQMVRTYERTYSSTTIC